MKFVQDRNLKRSTKAFGGEGGLRNINEVVKEGLCLGCGTCVGMCPSRAIEMCLDEDVFVPVVDSGRCNGCLKCLQCCPGYSVDVRELNARFFGKQPGDVCVGNFLACYVGSSCDEEVVSASSSGGIVDELLIHALESRMVDGCLVLRLKDQEPLRPEPFIARSRRGVLSGSRSKYCPAAPNVLLGELSHEKGRFAVVGLPCQIHGVRMAELLSESLRRKIVLHVGLFCGHTVNFGGTRLLLRKLGADEGAVKAVTYRGNGRPDFMQVETKGGRKLRLRFNKAWKAYWNVFAPFFFTLFRCMMCPDHFNELADVSVGDAWLPEFASDGSRHSIVIARTEVAAEMLLSMRDRGFISLMPITVQKAKQSQAFSINYKKQNLRTRLSFFRSLGKSTPIITPEPQRSSFVSLFEAFLSYLSFRLSSSRKMEFLLAYVPLPVYRVFFGLFEFVFDLSGRGRC